MDNPYDPRVMRRQFHKMRADKQVILDDPEYKALVTKKAEIDAKLQPLKTEIREVHGKLKAFKERIYSIDVARAVLARALGGRTGDSNDAT